MSTIFDCFPKASEDGWILGTVKRGTEMGNIFEEIGEIHPIVSDGVSASMHNTTTPDALNYDLMLYVRPEDIPVSNIGQVSAGYVVISPFNNAYDIAQVYIGKNQETGEVEHYELMLNLTEIEVGNE